MLHYKRIGEERGDCTAPYAVTMDSTVTVRQLIQTILEQNPKEWGYIGIKNNEDVFFGSPNCEYRYGRLTADNKKKDGTSIFDTKYLDSTIAKVMADGGWTRMDYIITI